MMMDKETRMFLAKILANQATMIEILCTLAAPGSQEQKDKLLHIALEQSRLHMEAIISSFGSDLY